MQLRQSAEETDDDGASHEAAIREVQQQAQMLKVDEGSFQILFRQVYSGCSRQEIGDVHTSQDSTAFVGMPEGVMDVKQRIGNVTTKSSSSAYVGIYPTNVDFRRSVRST